MGWEVISVEANTSSSKCLSLGRRGRVPEGEGMNLPFHLGATVDAPGKSGWERTEGPSLTLSHRFSTLGLQILRDRDTLPAASLHLANSELPLSCSLI